jgi:hypothetical protein
LLPDLLDAIGTSSDESEIERQELQLLNQLLTSVRRQDAQTPTWTAPVLALRSVHRTGLAPIFPQTGLSSPWLFTAGRADPSLFSELRAELSAADRVDILVSFIACHREFNGRAAAEKFFDLLNRAKPFFVHVDHHLLDDQPTSRLPSNFLLQAHSRLEIHTSFRLIPRWTRLPK